MTNKPVTNLKTPLTARKRAGHFLNHLKGFEFFGDSDGLEKDIDALTDEIEQAVKEAVKLAEREAREEGYDQANKDFDWLQSAVAKVYCALTNNKLSKWNTDPDLLLCEVEDIQNQFWEKEVAESYSSGYKEGFKSGAEAAATLIRHAWEHPKGTCHLCDKAREIRSLPLPSASSGTTVPGEGKEI